MSWNITFLLMQALMPDELILVDIPQHPIYNRIFNDKILAHICMNLLIKWMIETGMILRFYTVLHEASKASGNRHRHQYHISVFWLCSYSCIYVIPSNHWYKPHLSRWWYCFSLRCSWSIACRCCSYYIFILDLTPGFKGLDRNDCKTRPETFKFWDLEWLILEIRR